MSESERRRKYRYGRILIESARILSTQFDDAVVYLSGAQLEMLRNVSPYLRDLSTYVSEYQPGYYLTPDASDYDDILGIVSDLEESLMGNPNTIWGYKDRLAIIDSHTKVGDGYYYMWPVTVPEGYVYVLNLISVTNLTSVCTIEVFMYVDGWSILAARYVDAVAGDWYILPSLNYPLKDGDKLRVNFLDVTSGDDIRCRALGYSMKVPD